MTYEFKCESCKTKLEIICKYDNLKDELESHQPCKCGGTFKRVYGYDYADVRLGVDEINRRSIEQSNKVMDYLWNK